MVKHHFLSDPLTIGKDNWYNRREVTSLYIRSVFNDQKLLPQSSVSVYGNLGKKKIHFRNLFFVWQSLLPWWDSEHFRLITFPKTWSRLEIITSILPPPPRNFWPYFSQFIIDPLSVRPHTIPLAWVTLPCSFNVTAVVDFQTTSRRSVHFSSRILFILHNIFRGFIQYSQRNDGIILWYIYFWKPLSTYDIRRTIISCFQLINFVMRFSNFTEQNPSHIFKKLNLL